eukprot:GHVS01058855.1.p1 GENE.GHVS01058855.1~~GHVS01058855.1.p1  ORF type:complete len:363 (-),score=40.18 GHVS01058855.1:1214-2302(-)
MARKILWSWKIWILLIVVLQISQKTLRVSAVVERPVGTTPPSVGGDQQPSTEGSYIAAEHGNSAGPVDSSVMSLLTCASGINIAAEPVSAKPDKAAVDDEWCNKSTNLNGNTQTPATSSGVDAQELSERLELVAREVGHLGIDTGDDKAESAFSNEATSAGGDAGDVKAPSQASDAEGVDVELPDLNSADGVARQTKGVQSSEDIAAEHGTSVGPGADFKHTMSEKPSDTYSLRFDPDNLSMVSYEVVPFDPVDTSAAAPGGEQQPQRETHDNPDKAGSAFSNEGESNPPPGKDASTVVGSPSPSVSHSQNGVQNGVPLKPTFLEKKPHRRRGENSSVVSYKSGFCVATHKSGFCVDILPGS